jgi:hypothetical protein
MLEVQEVIAEGGIEELGLAIGQGNDEARTFDIVLNGHARPRTGAVTARERSGRIAT